MFARGRRHRGCPRPGPVVKVGGSLLEHGNLADTLQTWLANQAPAPAVLIAGGGRWVDAIRAADQRFHLGDEAAHWLSIRAMGLTARLLSALLPDLQWATDVDQLRPTCDKTAVLDAEDFLRRREPTIGRAPLPHSWQVTSDSIAVRVAEAIDAGELVLLKSMLPPPGTSLQRAAEIGYVDCYFPVAASGLSRVRCVNLRQDGWPELVWKQETTPASKDPGG